jgi:hypothetical protein
MTEPKSTHIVHHVIFLMTGTHSFAQVFTTGNPFSIWGLYA